MSTTISVSTTKPASVLADVLIVPVYDDLSLGRALPEAIRRKIGVQMRKVEFAGAWGQAIFFPLLRGSRIPFLAVVGLGKKEAAVAHHAEGMRRAVATVLHDARKHMLRSVAINLVHTDTPDALAAAAVEGALLADYRFAEYSARLRKDSEARSLRKLFILVRKEALQEVRESVRGAEAVLQGVTLARNLVNQPASAMAPATLVESARKIADASKHITLKVLDRAQAEQQNFRGFLAVARGSHEEPYVIHLTYTPAKPTEKKIFIVGKGITFDSGGLSLKPANYMETMKIDMAGAASVLGLFSVLEQLPVDVEVHGIIATCENMPSGNAYRPGDILTAKNGKTIEVLNTDAEGRITLADALSYATEHQPSAIIDLATLTGACVVALGDTIAGLWTTDEALQKQLLLAAETAGEGLCPMPLPAEYASTIQSSVADVRNTATMRNGGAITAALFLKEFVGENIPWAHLDVAGPVFFERSYLPYYQPGATGYGVRTLVEYLKAQK